MDYWTSGLPITHFQFAHINTNHVYYNDTQILHSTSQHIAMEQLNFNDRQSMQKWGNQFFILLIWKT